MDNKEEKYTGIADLQLGIGVEIVLHISEKLQIETVR